MKPYTISKNLRIREFPDEEKPRERLARSGEAALSNSELLAIIIGIGTRERNVVDLSKDLLSRYNLQELSQISVAELRKVNGIGSAKASQIVACFEIGRRLAAFPQEQKIAVTCAEDVFNLQSAKLRMQKKENLVLLMLDTRKHLLKEEVVFIGTLDTSIIHPREILKSAIKESASATIIVHNHPSGDPTPSDEDVTITRQLIEASELVGIPLLDHVIIGSSSYVSLRTVDGLRGCFR